MDTEGGRVDLGTVAVEHCGNEIQPLSDIDCGALNGELDLREDLRRIRTEIVTRSYAQRYGRSQPCKNSPDHLSVAILNGGD